MEQGRSQSLRRHTGANPLIPKDINESLGKLPPQALDLEQAVLGAVMLEKNAINGIPTLRPQHFYDDRHKEVFNAIMELRSLNEPHDFKMVINQLRKTGKLDLVGGFIYVVELTNAVSTSANVQFHARVIIENSIKRSLIEAASNIHHQGYEPDTDVLQLLDTTIEDLQFLRERETKSDGPERIKALWEKHRIVAKPDRPETLIKIGDADVCTVGNLSLLVGKKKSRKSLLITKLLHIFLQSNANISNEVCVFDTEQEEYDVWQAKDRIYRMTNQEVPFFCLRGLDPKERRDFIEQTITHWPGRLKIAVIDGIRDCMSNINDPDESTQVMSWLMKLNVETKIHIINVLHLNKTDNNARGHIGTELLNKAEITIEVELDQKSKELYPPSVVRCESSRRKPFEPFMFTHGHTGLPEVIGEISRDTGEFRDEQLTKLTAAFDGQAMMYNDLIEQLRAHFAVGTSKAKQMIAKFCQIGWVVKSGPARSKETRYKLVQVGQVGYPDQKKPEPVQKPLFDPGDEPSKAEDSEDLPF